MRKSTRQEIVNFIEGFGNTIKSKRIVSTSTKLVITCHSCNNDFTTTYNSFRQTKNGKCPECNKLIGENHPQYKHMSEEERKARENRLAEHRIFQNAVFALKGRKCIISGREHKRYGVTAHHLLSWHQYPELRNNPANGVPIAKKLHQEFHSRFGYEATLGDFCNFYFEKTGKVFFDEHFNEEVFYGPASRLYTAAA